MSADKIPTSTIAEMCELVVDCPHFTPVWTDDGYIVIRNQNIRNGRLDLSSPSFTHREDFERRIRRAKPQVGDIIITREAPMGEVCLVPDGVDCCLGQRQVLLRPKPNVDPEYLYCALQSPFVRRQIFWNEGTGSTVSNIRIPVLEAIEIPRWPEQESAIATTIIAIDDKIELNRRMNETLEAQALALFRDWFVDFGPVKAKMASNTPYLAPDLWSLFPNRLDDDGVPEGWGSISVGDVASLKGGKQLPKSEITATGPVPVYGGAGIMGFTIEGNAEGYVITVGRVGAYCGQFFSHRGTAWVNNNASLIAPNHGVSGEWLFLALKELNIETIKKGAAQPFVSNGDIAKLRLVWPSKEVMEAFLDLAGPLIRRQEVNHSENKALGQTRDLLLPKLMSGEIRVGVVASEELSVA